MYLKAIKDVTFGIVRLIFEFVGTLALSAIAMVIMLAFFGLIYYIVSWAFSIHWILGVLLILILIFFFFLSPGKNYDYLDFPDY